MSFLTLSVHNLFILINGAI